MDNEFGIFPAQKEENLIIDKKIKDGSISGRRSGNDRRKKLTLKYFIKGGFERRSWKERRKYWYLTM